MSEIKVHVVKYPDRTNLVMRYRCPFTNKHVQRSTGTSKKKEALKAAGEWEAELRSGKYTKPSRMAWQDFRDYYRAHALPSLAKTSVITYEATLNVFERLCRPQKLAEVTTAKITGFVTELRSEELSEATIARHLRHLKAAMRWANREGLLPVLPNFTMPKRVKGSKVMRGRPITLEEFERMLMATRKIVEKSDVETWRFYLRGLWTSGLRLSESLSLRWDNAPGAIVVSLDGKYPLLRIPAEAEKGHKDRLLPITPEFAELLHSVPLGRRRGRVFCVPDSRYVVGRIVSNIGRKAGIVVDEGKSATAHDLRRSFGYRWSRKVMPTVLRELMRHASIETTMAYYVGDNAEATAETLWNAMGTTLGTTPNSSDKSKRRRNAKSPAKQGNS